jgi:hypothetical protein
VANISQGTIIWAPYADKNGYNCYPRPVVILTLTAEIPHHDEVVGVIASHTASLQKPRPDHYIELPHHPSRRVSTKFDRSTVAMCDWSVKVKRSEIADENVGGHVCNEILELVVEKYLEYHKHRADVNVEPPPKPTT